MYIHISITTVFTRTNVLFSYERLFYRISTWALWSPDIGRLALKQSKGIHFANHPIFPSCQSVDDAFNCTTQTRHHYYYFKQSSIVNEITSAFSEGSTLYQFLESRCKNEHSHIYDVRHNFWRILFISYRNLNQPLLI